MKKLLAIGLVLIIGMLTACGAAGDNNATDSQNGGKTQQSSSADTKVTDAYEMIFDFTIRQDLNGTDASISQRYFLVDVTWDGLNFNAESVFNREVQHHSGRYDVQEDVTISGRLSADEKHVEFMTFANERTGDIYEMLEFEIVNIPYTKDNAYAEGSHKFYVRAGADALENHLKIWNEQTREGGEVTSISDKLEFIDKYDQEVEISVNFFFD